MIRLYVILTSELDLSAFVQANDLYSHKRMIPWFLWAEDIELLKFVPEKNGAKYTLLQKLWRWKAYQAGFSWRLKEKIFGEFGAPSFHDDMSCLWSAWRMSTWEKGTVVWYARNSQEFTPQTLVGGCQGKEQLEAHAMKRVAASAHLPTPWLFWACETSRR